MTETMTETVGSPEGSSRNGDLSRMRIPELRSMAQSMGVRATSGMRKSDLIAAIRTGGSEGGSGQAAASQPQKGSPRRRSDAGTDKGDEQGSDSPSQASNDSRDPQGSQDSVQEGPSSASGGEQSDRSDRRDSGRQDSDRQDSDRQDRRDSGRQDSNRRNSGRQDSDRSDRRNSGRQGSDNNSGGDAQRGGERGGNDQRSTSNDSRNNDSDDSRGGQRNDRRRRRGRERTRERGRGRPGEPQISDDDVLIPAAGILDLMDNYAFVRTSGYLPGPNDLYVSMSMVKRFKLRKGDAITGVIKQPYESDRREKYTPLARVDTVNGTPVADLVDRPDFNTLTPLYPQDRLRLETDGSNPTTRVIDIVAPIGKGQRGLIVSPPKAGKTMVLQSIANAITANDPDCHLMVVLVDERPEEVTDMQRSVKGEVIASTFDRPAGDHTTVAELAIERAKRLVELGHDVVVLLDSMTRLGRAYNLAAPASGRILSGGVDSAALYPPKKFFGAARNIEDGGSLTILATALVETGSKMDEVIFEEFKGTGNMELKLDRRLADKRVFPAVDVESSGTRKEELLMSTEELKIVWKLRRVLHGLDPLQSIELLLTKLRETGSNYEFLLQVQQNTPTSGGMDPMDS